MARNHEVRIKLSQEEFTKIKLKAQQVSMTTSAFIRFIALNSTIKPTLED